MAQGSNVSIEIESTAVPALPGAYELLDLGCIPGAAFRNLEHVEESCRFADSLDYNLKRLLADAQTSGGLLICCPQERSGEMLAELHKNGCAAAAAIGIVTESGPSPIYIS